jgi:hypothetical protein
MKTRAWCGYAAGLLLLCGCAGCAPSISGTVKLNGEPLADGDIQFIPIEGTPGPDAGAVIKDGKYKVVQKGLAGGKYRVSIRGYKQSGKLVPDPLSGPPVKETVQIVPREYHGEKSKLVREITRGTNPPLDFDLETPGAGK